MGKFPFQSKTFWAGVVLVAAAIASYLTSGALSETQVISAASGIGLIGIRDALGD